jgi:hypothetical protein
MNARPLPASRAKIGNSVALILPGGRRDALAQRDELLRFLGGEPLDNTIQLPALFQKAMS